MNWTCTSSTPAKLPWRTSEAFEEWCGRRAIRPVYFSQQFANTAFLYKICVGVHQVSVAQMRLPIYNPNESLVVLLNSSTSRIHWVWRLLVQGQLNCFFTDAFFHGQENKRKWLRRFVVILRMWLCFPAFATRVFESFDRSSRMFPAMAGGQLTESTTKTGDSDRNVRVTRDTNDRSSKKDNIQSNDLRRWRILFYNIRLPWPWAFDCDRVLEPIVTMSSNASWALVSRPGHVTGRVHVHTKQRISPQDFHLTLLFYP
jgi:hypothetical protein